MPIFQLKIALRGSKPPIWRIVEVKDDTNLYLLHCIIQGAMGWDNTHLHQFIVGGTYYGLPDTGADFDHDERKTKISQILREKKSSIEYEYDFGDSWLHNIELKEILLETTGETYPRLVKGKGVCPPEDCGGLGGFYDLLEALKDPKHPEHEEMTEDYDPDEFNSDRFDLEKHQYNTFSAYQMGIASKGREAKGWY